MIKFYYSIINIGRNELATPKEQKRIRILNISAIILGINALIPLTFFFIRGDLTRLTGFVFITEFFLYMFTIVLNKIRQTKIAKIFILSLFIAILFIHNNFLFPHEYVEYYYLGVPLGSLFFYDKKSIGFGLLVMAVILFYVPNMYFNIYDGKNFGYFHAGLFFIVSYIMVLYFKNENEKNEKKLEETYIELKERKQSEVADLQLKSLKAQMNPHFMFNTLNSIQHLILKGDKHEAYNYLTKFSLLIRNNLNMSEKTFVHFDEELGLLNKYLELEKLRFKEGFTYQIENQIAEIDVVKVPSMIIQPFIENAIKHGLLHKVSGLKKVIIEFSLGDKHIVCIITDNGIGRDASKKINDLNDSKPNSFSTKAIQERLKLLKEYYKTDIGVTYEDVQEGTKVIIRIPYINLND
jgi:sensor histidine kinase YesM